jgi:hypothetical protein
MVNEAKVLAVVKMVTDVRAYFFEGTLFLETEDSKIATEVFCALTNTVTPLISFGLCGQSETSYDFIGA